MKEVWKRSGLQDIGGTEDTTEVGDGGGGCLGIEGWGGN